jgi:uncharacterized protein with HEPN domain
MKRDVRLFIEDILISIKAIEKFSRNLKRESLDSNRLRQSAIVREIEIIGEAVKNLPHSLLEKYPKVPWKTIAGSRDRIAHAYFKIDLDVVWKIVQEDLPVLKKQIQDIKKDLEEKNKKRGIS